MLNRCHRRLSHFRRLLHATPAMRHDDINRRAKLIIASDFDETITVTDTISCIANAAIDARRDADAKAQARSDWAAVVAAYLRDINEHKARLADYPVKSGDYRSLVDRLESQRTVEDASLDRVAASQVLRGLCAEQLAGVGRSVAVHEECARVLASAIATGSTVAIVSANWSRILIASALAVRGVSLSPAYIISNDLVVMEPEAVSEDPLTPPCASPASESCGRCTCPSLSQRQCEHGIPRHMACTGDILRDIVVATDKLRAFNAFVQRVRSSLSTERSHAGAVYHGTASVASVASPATASSGMLSAGADSFYRPSVFIGDSTSDLLALLAADVGVVVGRNASLFELCRTAGIAILPLLELHTSCDSAPPPPLRRARASPMPSNGDDGAVTMGPLYAADPAQPWSDIAAALDALGLHCVQWHG